MTSVAAYIAEARDAIIEGFVREAGRVPSARGLTRDELLDSLPDYLTILGPSTRSDELLAAHADDRQRIEESHVLLRLRLGFEVHEVEAECDLVLELIRSRWDRRPSGERPSPREVERLVSCLLEARRLYRRQFEEYTQAESQREKRHLRELERHAERMIYFPGQSVPLVRRLEPLLAVIREATGADGCALQMAVPAGGPIAHTASVGDGAGPTGFLSRALAEEPFRGQVLRSFVAVPGSCRGDGDARRLLGRRLPAHGTLQGVVVVGAAGGFSLPQRRTLEALCERLAGIVLRARLFERLPTRHGTVRTPGSGEPRDLVGEVERSPLRYLLLGIYEWDVTTGALAWSESSATLLGYPIDQLGTDIEWWRERLHPDERDRVVAEIDAVLAGREDQWQGEYRFLTHDSGYMLFSDNSQIIRDREGRPIRMIGAIQSIGPRREAERQLRASEERLNLAVRAAGMGTWDLDLAANRFHWDARNRELMGVGPDEEITYEAFLATIHPDDRARVAEAAQRALDPRGADEFDEEFRTRDGRWIRSTGRAFFEEGRPVRFIGVVQDVNAIHEAADALARSEREFRVLSEAMPQLVWTARSDGTLVYVNRRSLEYSGRPTDEVLGHRWLELVHPDDAPRVRAAWAEAVATGGRYELKQRIRAADGSYGWFLTRGVPLRDRPDGPVQGWLGTSTDIAELQQAEDVLRRSTEFAQQLLGIVSHDLKNPLNAVLVGAQMLLRSGALDPRQARTAARILTAGERAIRLVGDLLDLTRARLGEGIPIVPRELDFDELVGRVIDEARLAHPDRALRFAAGRAGRGRWDADRVAQVVTNLVSNAISYSPPGTAVEIETRGGDDRVELSVHNRGDPIPPGLLPRIFEPMLRGQGADGATGGIGLGLFIVDRIVRSHGGRVEVTSTAISGTIFRVTLPREHPGGSRAGS